MPSQRVLGLSLGTCKIGIAITEKYAIYYCQMKSFRASWSPKKLQTILAVIESYIVKYRVVAIALKIPPSYSHTPAISELLSGIDLLAKATKLPLHTITLIILKNSWSTVDQKINKKKLMEAILQKYNLVHVYKKEMKNKTRHYEKLFEAVGAADIVLRDI